MADVQTKLDLLKEIVADESDFSLVLDKLLNVISEQHRSLLKRYQTDLQDFEARYGMPSAEFYRKFELGELGDAMDSFEWAGLFELQQNLLEKIQRLETA
ncbi:MAG: hypothetical protein BroJett011_54720 [Chloroflexota bacterium]|nr:MAG: hypothetical protein BroJett011_54720 [Chloroflexota bacterium]